MDGDDPGDSDQHISAYAKLEFEQFSFFIQTLTLIIGRKAKRDDNVDVHLGMSKAISRAHAKIYYQFDATSWEIEVLGKNGAFVNERYIEAGGTSRLRNTDRLQIGEIPFTFLLPEGATAPLNPTLAKDSPTTNVQSIAPTTVAPVQTVKGVNTSGHVQSPQVTNKPATPLAPHHLMQKSLSSAAPQSSTPTKPLATVTVNTPAAALSTVPAKMKPVEEQLLEALTAEAYLTPTDSHVYTSETSSAKKPRKKYTRKNQSTRSEDHTQEDAKRDTEGQSASQSSNLPSRFPTSTDPTLTPNSLSGKSNTSKNDKTTDATHSATQKPLMTPKPATTDATGMTSISSTTPSMTSQRDLLSGISLPMLTELDLAIDSPIWSLNSQHLSLTPDMPPEFRDLPPSLDLEMPDLPPEFDVLQSVEDSTKTEEERKAAAEEAAAQHAAQLLHQERLARQAQEEEEGLILPPPETDPAVIASFQKPSASYATMIYNAIASHEKKKMTLAQIYSWICIYHPYYRYVQNGWQNSIRHNLSLNKAFMKVPRTDDEPGKGSFWAVDPESEMLFEGGVYKKKPPRPTPSAPISKGAPVVMKDGKLTLNPNYFVGGIQGKAEEVLDLLYLAVQKQLGYGNSTAEASQLSRILALALATQLRQSAVAAGGAARQAVPAQVAKPSSAVVKPVQNRYPTPQAGPPLQKPLVQSNSAAATPIINRPQYSASIGQQVPYTSLPNRPYAYTAQSFSHPPYKPVNSSSNVTTGPTTAAQPSAGTTRPISTTGVAPKVAPLSNAVLPTKSPIPTTPLPYSSHPSAGITSGPIVYNRTVPISSPLPRTSSTVGTVHNSTTGPMSLAKPSIPPVVGTQAATGPPTITKPGVGQDAVGKFAPILTNAGTDGSAPRLPPTNSTSVAIPKEIPTRIPPTNPYTETVSMPRTVPPIAVSTGKSVSTTQQGVSGKPLEPKSVEPRTIESKSTDSKLVESQTIQSKTVSSSPGSSQAGQQSGTPQMSSSIVAQPVINHPVSSHAINNSDSKKLIAISDQTPHRLGSESTAAPAATLVQNTPTTTSTSAMHSNKRGLEQHAEESINKAHKTTAISTPGT